MIDSQNYRNYRNDPDDFISYRHSKVRTKGSLNNSISMIKDSSNEDVAYRYAPIRNPENQNYKKRSFLSPLQSLEQSFEIYKKAAEI